MARVQSWKDEYEQTILGQLKAMGCSCDFARTAFTMDAPRAKAVREAFFRLFKDGLIYRGKRLVNWDPVTQTALADDEVENEEIDGHFYYLKYPLTQSRDREGAPGDAAVETGPLPMDAGEAETATDDPRARSLPDGRGSAPMTQGRDREGALADAAGETALSSPDAGEAEAAVDDPRSRSLPHGRGSESYIVVATTRPETMLGDTAVAINPRDPRAASLRGKFVKLPLVDRLIPIVEDDYVVMPTDDDPKAKFATGFLKVTPAHDPNDWDIGQRHNLEVINVMAPDASISDAHGWTPETDAARRFVGQSREDARKERRAMVQGPRPAGGNQALPPQRRPQLPQPRPRRAVPERPVVRRRPEAHPLDARQRRRRGDDRSRQQFGRPRANGADTEPRPSGSARRRGRGSRPVVDRHPRGRGDELRTAGPAAP